MTTLLCLLTVVGAGVGAADDARELLRQGLLGVAASPGITATLSMDSDVASLQALLSDDEGELTPQAAQVLLATSVQTTFPVAVPGDWFAISVRSAGVDWAELRVVDGILYGRADVRTWAEMVGADPAVLDEAYAALERDGVLPPEALEGRWIAVTEPDGVVAAASAQDHALGRLGMAIVDSAQVELVGSDEHGDRLRVTVSPRTLRDVLALELSALSPGGAADFGLPPSQSVPDVPVELDLWVRDGYLVAARLDLMQLGRLAPEHALPPGVERLAVLLQLQPFDGQLAAPDGALEVDGDRLFETLLDGEMPTGPQGPDGPGGGKDDGGTRWPDAAPRVPQSPRKVQPGGGSGGAAVPAPLSLDALLGVDLSRSPRARPAATAFPGAMEPDTALAEFYSRPGYGEARRRYCLQLDDVPDTVWARHYADICPGSHAGSAATA